MTDSIRDALAAGKPSLGSWLNLASPLAAEVMAAAGYSWLVVDAEHTAFDLGLITHTFRAIEARGAVALARVWDHDPVTIGRVLDAGACGLVLPHVSTPEEAQEIVSAMRYPPFGTRSSGTGRCVTLADDYRQRANDQLLCIPQIEDIEGINNAEAIAMVDGVDIGFLGPSDLALSMGVSIGSPEHEQELQRFREACARAGVPSGLPVPNPSDVPRRLEEGFQFIDIASDLRFMDNAAREALTLARSG
jgi:2-keto-3-deoxy-L-rhamnonate aldolase RhmA